VEMYLFEKVGPGEKLGGSVSRQWCEGNFKKIVAHAFDGIV
jgi:hypothetical protein